jgi:hypothetical protein
MERWTLPSILVRVSAAVLVAMAVFDLAKLSFWLLLTSILGDLAQLLPTPLRGILGFVAAVSQILLALAAASAIVAIVCAILLFRFAERVDAGTFSPGERTAWLVALAALAALSALFGKWLYAAVYAVALAGVAIARSWW